MKAAGEIAVLCNTEGISMVFAVKSCDDLR